MSFLKQVRRASLCFLITALLGVSLSQAAVAINENEYLVFYHHDALGSPAATTNENGQILSRESSKPFGKSTGKTSSDGNPLVEGESAQNESRVGYTGHTFDGGSELVYMKARFYDPAIGRFYSNDPVGFNTGNLMMFNRYAYANNNPYKYVDPDGRLVFLAIPAAFEFAAIVKATLFVGTAAAAGYGLSKLDDNVLNNESDDGSTDSQPGAPATPTSSPALDGDPYSPEAVEERQQEWADAYTDPVADAATANGFDREVPRQRAPFNPHGQRVFTDGKTYISPDHTGHKVSDGWKTFDGNGNRTGTWNSDLSDKIGK